MFAVLRRRYGRVIREDFREGENIFVISARLPVIESFGLSAEIRKRTSGTVNLPQLRPGGWELLDIDPLQKINTEKQRKSKSCKVHDDFNDHHPPDEEDECIGQIARIQKYIRDVRKRKGLPLNEQLVISAEKQRTLKKNK